MRVTVNRRELKDKLQFASRIAATKSPIAVLEGIKLSAKEGELHIYSTDLENSAHIILPAKVEESGECVVSSKLTLKLISQLDSDEIEFQLLDGKLMITAGNFSGELALYPLEEFPDVIFSEPELRLRIPAHELKALIERVVFASSFPDDTNPVFAGALLELEDGKLALVATDGSQLARREIDVDSSDTYSGIVPVKMLLALVKVIPLIGEIELELSSANFGVFMDNVHVNSRLISGEFPMYKGVIPEEFNTQFTLRARDFISAIKRVLLLSKAHGLEGIIRLNVDEDGLKVSSLESEIGKAVEKVEIFNYSGEPQDIAFNGKLLLEAVSKAGYHEVTFKMIDDTSPMMMVTEEDGGYLYLLMPVRVTVEV